MEVKVGFYKKHYRKNIDAFQLWCWEKLLKIKWRVKKINQWSLNKHRVVT